MIRRHLTHPPHLARLVLLSALLLGGCAPAAPGATASHTAVVAAASNPTLTAPAAAPVALDTQQDLLGAMAAIAGAQAAEAQARADALWQAILNSRREPLIYDNEVYFFYKGAAQHVDWRGGFNQWATPGLQGVRIGQTDLWMAQLPVVPASRSEYQIAIDDQPLRLDAANPLTQTTGLTTANSLLVMPGFTVSDEGQRRAGVPMGTVTGPLSITSRYLGYVVDYWVYTPAGYANDDRLPAIFLLDGNDFVMEQKGALPIVLDNLIATRRIRPALAVFVDEREPGNPQNNRREPEFLGHPREHAAFLAEELAPAVDQAYRTDPRPQARVIAGVSYGGLSATFIAATEWQTFGGLAAFSPSLWALDAPNSQPNAQQAAGIRLMQPYIQSISACGGDTGFDCPRLPLRIFLSWGVPNWDVGDLSGLAGDLQRQGYPLSLHTTLEAHTWSQWRGLSDEMLEFFFHAN